MEYIKIKEELYLSVLNQLKEFAKSAKANNIYAIAFDLDEFDYVLRYQTLAGYCETKTEYISRHGYKEDAFRNESLTGFKYGIGDFQFIEETAEERFGSTGYLKNFFDSMTYYACDYIEDESRIIPRDELPDDLYQFLLESCLYCAEKLKDNLGFLNKTEDFIIFVAEHDSSDERKLNLISKTVDHYLFQKLCPK